VEQKASITITDLGLGARTANLTSKKPEPFM
jgi:hypothetical protein